MSSSSALQGETPEVTKNQPSADTPIEPLSQSPRFRSVLPHEPPPKNHESSCSRATIHGYMLMQGAFLPKKRIRNDTNKSELTDSENSKDERKNDIDEALAKEILEVLEQKLLCALQRLLSSPSTSNNDQRRTDELFGNVTVALQNPSRALIQFSSFDTAQKATLYLRRTQPTPQSLLGTTDTVSIQTHDTDGAVEEYGKRPIQVTHVTNHSLPSNSWEYNSPPKFRRLLSSQSTPTEELPNVKGGAAPTMNNTRFVYMTGFASMLQQNAHENDLSFPLLCQKLRNLLNPYDSSGDGVELWFPTVTSKKKSKTKKKNERDNSASKACEDLGSISYCYIGMRSHEDAATVIRSLMGASVSTLLKSHVNNSGSLSNNDTTNNDCLFLDYASYTQRPFPKKGHNVSKETPERQPSRSECTSKTSHVHIPGLFLLPNFISADEEECLLASLLGPHAPWMPPQSTMTGLGDTNNDETGGSLNRRVQHYGYVFDYQTAAVLRDPTQGSGRLGWVCPPMPGLSHKDLQSTTSAVGITGENIPFQTLCNDVLLEKVEVFINTSVKDCQGWDVVAGVMERLRYSSFTPSSTSSSSTTHMSDNVTCNSISINGNPATTSTDLSANTTKEHQLEQHAPLQFSNLNQVTLNEYQPGQGIGSHIDTPSSFGDGLISLSLSSDVVMEFTLPPSDNTSFTNGSTTSSSKLKKLVHVPARSLLIMTGPARYQWRHGIVSRKTDTVNGQVVTRGKRLSLTFRTALEVDGFTNLTVRKCRGLPQTTAEKPTTSIATLGKQDQGRTISNDTTTVDTSNVTTITSCTTTSAAINPKRTPPTELHHVQKLYDAIAVQWHHTRGKRGVIWPSATTFLTSLPRGSLVADVGCGDGKYFAFCQQKSLGLVVLGTDVSQGLLKQTIHKANDHFDGSSSSATTSKQSQRTRPNVAVGDCVNIPLRSCSMDAVLCVAVLHHLSTRDRRLQALREMTRIVKTGGKVHVQAWALEQEEKSRRKFKDRDVFVPFNVQPRFLKQMVQDLPDLKGDISAKNAGEAYTDAYNTLQQQEQKDEEETTLPNNQPSSHASSSTATNNKVEYNADKGLVTFQRYCHVYKKGELEELVRETPGLTLVESGYESSNHYVVACKDTDIT